MSSSLVRLTVIGYVLVLSLALGLLLLPNSLQAQKGFGVSTGYRATPALPTIAIPMLKASTGGFGAVGGGGVLGAGGQAGGTNVSGSVSTEIVTVNLGQFFPNNGQIIGLPPPTATPMLSNFLFGPFSGDSTTAPWALLTAGGVGGGGAGGAGGGVAGAGGGVGGFGGGIAGGVGGQGGGGVGGFAGKGMGGFNGKKAL